jgi:hypothetical protein
MLKLYTTHLALDRRCFEAVLIENIPRTLRVNFYSKEKYSISLNYMIKFLSSQL